MQGLKDDQFRGNTVRLESLVLPPDIFFQGPYLPILKYHTCRSPSIWKKSCLGPFICSWLDIAGHDQAFLNAVRLDALVYSLRPGTLS